MSDKRSLFAELKRRNVLRGGALYAAGVWALAQGIAQLAPTVGAPDWVTRWFLLAAIIGFPFWIAFAWVFEFTPGGLKRESEIDPADAVARGSSRKLDFWIIGVLAAAVVLLLTDRLVVHKDVVSTATADIPFKSIAVLPLTNESGDEDQQFFSDGLTEDLITALSQFAGLKVISRNSAFQFRNSREDSRAIGARLGVAHLLEGSVRRLGDQVRVTAQLVNAADGSTLWSQRYDRLYKDLFRLQDDITRTVATALKTTLLSTEGAVVQSDRPPSGNLDAYTAYLRAGSDNTLGTEANFHQMIDAYETAIRLDPHYAAAFAKLSGVWQGYANQLLGGEEARRARDKARQAANTALALDPTLAVAHRARGDLLFTTDFNWSGAESEYREALRLAPNNSGAQFQLGILLATLGQPEQAIDLLRRAVAADPLQDGYYHYLGVYLASMGRLDEAEQATRKAIELQPARSTHHELLASIEILRGHAPAALSAAQQEPAGPWRDVAMALALQIGSDHAAADVALQTLVEKYADQAAYQIAQVYALRKEPKAMFQWLHRAWASRDPGITYLLTDPFVRRYQHDPRFNALCKELGLPAPKAAATAVSR